MTIGPSIEEVNSIMFEEASTWSLFRKVAVLGKTLSEGRFFLLMEYGRNQSDSILWM